MANEEAGVRLTAEQFGQFLQAGAEAMGGVAAPARRSTVDKSNMRRRHDGNRLRAGWSIGVENAFRTNALADSG